MNRKTRVFVYETISADPSCADAALLSQGRSMRDAMVADLAAVDGVAVTCAVCGDGDPIAARVQAARRRPDEPPADFLRRQASLHDLVWVVAPESDGMLRALSLAVEEPQWLGCSPKAIEIAGSKRATALQLLAAGIAATEPLDAGPARSGAAAVRPGRWVVKPDDGCGAAGARRHDDYEAARFDFDSRRHQEEDVVMELWIDGAPLSISLLCNSGRAELLAVNRQHIGVDGAGFLRFDGVSRDARTTVEAAVTARALAALGQRVQAALPGLRGFVGIDVTWNPERGPVVIEINPRVTCAYEGLSASLGRNIAQEVLTLHRRSPRTPVAAFGASALC